MKEIRIFQTISLLSTYIYIKEKHQSNLIDIENKNELLEIKKLITRLEKYSHIADKEKIIEENYKNILGRIKNGSLSEASLIEDVKSATADLDEGEKTYILNSVIYIAYKDNMLSDTEWGQIKQVSNTLGFTNTKKNIEKNYNNSEFNKSISNSILLSIYLLIITLVIGFAYWYYSSNKQDINIFKNEKIVFSEVSYNRYVVYKNKYSVDSSFGTDYFLKQEVFYLSGSAEISIDPNYLNYNANTHTLTITYPKHQLFKVSINFNKTKSVDSISPKEISKEDARKVGAIVGIAGAVTGAIVANKMSSIVPPPYSIAVSGIGAAIGTFTGYAVTTSALNGLKLSKDITEREKQLVVKTAKQLILVSLKFDKKLHKMYLKSFEKYITLKYGTIGVVVENIVYKELK